MTLERTPELVIYPETDDRDALILASLTVSEAYFVGCGIGMELFIVDDEDVESVYDGKIGDALDTDGLYAEVFLGKFNEETKKQLTETMRDLTREERLKEVSVHGLLMINGEVLFKINIESLKAILLNLDKLPPVVVSESDNTVVITSDRTDLNQLAKSIENKFYLIIR